MGLHHKEFLRAGQQNGLQIWRIEKLELVPVPENLHGGFYTGDAYLVLYTIKGQDSSSYDLHFWLGDHCTQDERTAAAIFSMQMDDYLGGKPVQYRETQGSESTKFTSYFKGGIKYKAGGVASGFHHVVTNDLSASRLLHIKGRRTVRAIEVPLSWASFNKGDCFIADLGAIQVLPEGGETPIFKQFFSSWKEKDQAEGLGRIHVTERIAKIQQVEFDASQLHSSQQMAAQFNMVDDGSGKTQIWRVECATTSGDTKVSVDPDTYGQFYGGDCYIILYTYTKGEIIYTWQGSSSTIDELTASAFLTVELDRSLGGNAVQVRVTQGKEPPHLLSLFKDKPLIVYQNGTSRKDGQAPSPPTQLFQVRKNLGTITRISEVDAKASSLNSNDAYLLKLPQGEGYIWNGKGAKEEEEKGAKYMSKKLKCKTKTIIEGKEPEDFWMALGGKTEYQTSKLLESSTTAHPPRLFACSNKTGKFIIEEVPGEFNQDDLAEDDVMLLDVWETVFIWIGKEANEVERTESEKSAKSYIETDPSGRDRGTPLVVVKQGYEPPTFTGWFLGWDASRWDSDLIARAVNSLSVV
ncbi:hypothetical protein DNTS_025156 [Danionella cerebrum]|uniref:Scinderin n=1 Tax=Danionella cerebrum TaxID=2873325 RepID=A0A553R8M7_9TELE|nr:hypothetical protein DNTS_025156 [Danionella translucida]